MTGCGGCGRELPPGRIEFRAVCAGCSGWLHTCRHCELFDPKSHHECRASATAEYVADKEKFNFCEEFTPALVARRVVKSGMTREQAEKLFPGLS